MGNKGKRINKYPTKKMPRILGKKEAVKGKALNLKFNIDCTQPCEDKVLMIADFKEFLEKKVKVNGKLGNLGTEVAIGNEGSKIVVSSSIPFSKRYLKYLTKKYLKKQTLRNYLYVTSSDRNTYQMRYFNIQ